MERSLPGSSRARGAAGPARLRFPDALRGAAVVLMVLNHTARWWMDGTMGWPRYHYVFATMATAAPLFFFLVGYGLALSYRASLARSEPSRAVAAKNLGRGARVVLAGLLLNVIVFPGDPIWSWGVLQTIGLSIIVLIPALLVVGAPRGRWALVAVALLYYLGFVAGYPTLRAWVPAHPDLARAVFFEFPPWPWMALPVIGLTVGWTDTALADDATRGARFARMAGVAALWGLASVVYGWLTGTGPHLSFNRDLSLNNHWNPRPVTVLWVMGFVLATLALAYYLCEARRWRLGWLVDLGQAALFIYFIHQIIVLRIARQGLGVLTNSWWLYAVANVALMAVLVVLARGWLALRGPLGQAARAWLTPRRKPAS